MSTVVNTEWIAVKDDEIECSAFSRGELKKNLWEQGKDPDEYDLLKVPKPVSSMFI